MSGDDVDPGRRLLQGIRVVELGDGVAGAVAAAVLASLGAAVTKVVAARRPVTELGPLDIAGRPVLASLLDLDKELVVGDATDPAHAAGADIAILDAVDATLPLDAVQELAASSPAAVWLGITPFGLTGPRAGQAGGELVAAAAGGLLATVVGGDERPVSPAGFVALRATGHAAALAALHGLDRYRSTGRPARIDLSAQEAVVFTTALPECAHAIYRCPGQAGSGRYVAPSGLFPCRDGLVRIAAIEDHQWQGMVRCLGEPEWTIGLERREQRAEHAALINEHVAAWSATQDKARCAELLQEAGVPSTPVNGPDELLVSPQLDARHRLERRKVGAGDAIVPRPPWVVDLDGAGAARAAGSLSALRVLELTHVLAGPIVGALLGAMGADVLRFEDLGRLDIYRRTGPFAEGIAGVERGAYFAVANHSKTSVATASEDAATTVAGLLAERDVVIENVGGSRLARLGVDPAEVASAGVLTARVSGFGSDGPLARYKVYANNVQAYGGLAHLTRDRAGDLAHLGTVVADPLSSVVAATVIAAWCLGPEHVHGGVADLSMAEVVMSTIGEYVIAASTGADPEIPLGNEVRPHAPHGVYRTSDGWIAIAVQSDDEWTSLLGALDTPDALATHADRSMPARWEVREQLDAALESVTGERTTASLLEALVPAGVRTAAVQPGRELVTDEHLASRGFFPLIDHADATLSDARLVGMPWRFVDEGPLPLVPPPSLGNANSAWGLQEVDR